MSSDAFLEAVELMKPKPFANLGSILDTLKTSLISPSVPGASLTKSAVSAVARTLPFSTGYLTSSTE